MHVNTEALVDIAEGTRPEASAPHLADCEACRAQLRELRAMMAVAQDAVVPEPSPLFWDHLSARVSEAVAAESAPRRPWRHLLLRRWGVFDPMLALGVAALLVAIVVNSRMPVPAPAAAPGVAVETSAPAELLGDLGDTDASLTVVASLTDDADLETVREAGLAPRGSAEHAVTHMSDTELRELQRLLKEEMTRSGA
jgi:hypothetical protein